MMKKRILKKHVNALWRATCVWERQAFQCLAYEWWNWENDEPTWQWQEDDTVIKRAVEPITGRYMRSLWYRFRAWRRIPEIGEAYFGDGVNGSRFRFNKQRKYVVEVTPYDRGFMRRAADTPTRRQASEWRREREELEAGARIW